MQINNHTSEGNERQAVELNRIWSLHVLGVQFTEIKQSPRVNRARGDFMVTQRFDD